MKFYELFNSYIANVFRGSEAEDAVKEFVKHIPGRVLQIPFDGAHSNKQGIKEGDKVYKLGLDASSSTVFIEYLENYNQGQPTMAIYINKSKPQIVVSGWQVDRNMYIKFDAPDGVVKKAVKYNK